MKFLIEFGPLLVFFIGNFKAGPMWGTGLFMVATAIALAVSYFRDGHLAKVPLFSAVFVGIFGGLTLYLQDEVFIQVKVTLINIALGAALLGGLWFNRYYLKYIIGEALQMPDSAWRSLTLRWGLFFIATAALNEVLRHALSWDNWVWFKTFGLIGLNFVFVLANLPFMSKHIKEEPASSAEGPQGQP